MTNDNLVIEPNDNVSKLAAVKRKTRISLPCVKPVSTALVLRSGIQKSIKVDRTALPPYISAAKADSTTKFYSACINEITRPPLLDGSTF